jgi:anti-anti-sigma factor
MQIKILFPDGDIIRLAAEGRVSRDTWAHNGDPLTHACGPQIFKSKVLLSLRQVLYLDSTGVEWLLVCQRKFQQQGGRMILHSLVPATLQLLKMMRMDTLLEIEPEESAARQRLAATTNHEPESEPASPGPGSSH